MGTAVKIEIDSLFLPRFHKIDEVFILKSVEIDSGKTDHFGEFFDLFQTLHRIFRNLWIKRSRINGVGTVHIFDFGNKGNVGVGEVDALGQFHDPAPVAFRDPVADSGNEQYIFYRTGSRSEPFFMRRNKVV